jgi:hypothetical protein
MTSDPSSPPPPPLPAGTDVPSPSSSAAAPAILAPAVPAAPVPTSPALLAPAPVEKDDVPLPPVKLDYLGAVLSYLIPGLGQVYQGRIGKGLLFFFGLYTLFFYGMWMGRWHNVWLPDVSDMPPVEVPIFGKFDGLPKALYYRPQFMGQFWIGVAAWPSVLQYSAFDPNKDRGPLFGTFQRMPPEGTPNDPPEKITLNKLQREGNKRWDLGWVYTVIAGVLNLLVIYDALAGPMFREPPSGKKEDEPAW